MAGFILNSTPTGNGMSEPIAYLNGNYVPISQASLHVFDMGVVGGTSVSEMVRTFRHQPFLLDEHLARFQSSLDLVGFSIGMTMQELGAVCREIVADNSHLISEEHDLGLIVFVTAGLNLTYTGQTGSSPASRPTVCAHTFPLPFELWARSYEAGLHLVTVSVQPIPDEVINPRVKHRSRLHWHLATQEARKISSDAMAVLTDGDDCLTETATGNVCVVDGATIITPAAHALKGISSDYASRLAHSLGLSFIHAPVSIDDLHHADEAFLTSTPHCLSPITKFNQQPIGNGQPGPIFRRLIDAWGASVGMDIIRQMQLGAVQRMTPST